MVFSSLTFLLYFLPLVMILYFARSGIRWRNNVLLCASLLFYAWGEPIWIFAMLASTAVNYFCALKISRSNVKQDRKFWMLLGVAASAVMLFVCKYASFVVNSVAGIFSPSITVFNIELPIGISFYTFQIITYTVDVYRKKTRAQKSFARVLLYVSCFPQLIAGPIVQYSDIAAQIGKRVTTPDGFARGMQRFVIGLGKKVIFANVCYAALSAMPQAGGGAALSVAGAWYAAFLYTMQIYFDFSGYSDMAIGLGLMLGFRYKENFNYPYIATSVREFWRRWHISLGNFFREYVYIPLGGNRRGLKRTLINTFIVWALTGFWHGANWTFLVWGLYYGAILAIDLLGGKKLMSALPKPAAWLITFALVMFGWMIFYYPSLGQAFTHIGAMLGLGSAGFIDGAALQIIKTYSFFPLLAFLASLPMAQWFKRGAVKLKLRTRSVDALRVAWLSACLILSALLLVGQSANPFIYFQF